MGSSPVLFANLTMDTTHKTMAPLDLKGSVTEQGSTKVDAQRWQILNQRMGQWLDWRAGREPQPEWHKNKVMAR
jgi:hypothetical protein